MKTIRSLLLFLAWLAPGLVPATPPARPEPDLLVVLNKSDHTASLLAAESGELLATLPTGKGPHEVAVSPDGSRAVVANYGVRGAAGHTLTVLDLRKMEALRTIELGEKAMPHGILFLPEGPRVVVTAEGRDSVLVVDIDQGRVLAERSTEQKVSHMVALAPDGTAAWVANIGSGSVTRVDLAGGSEPRSVSTGAGAEGIALRPGGRELWVTNRSADTVSVLHPESLEILAQIPCASFPIRIAFTPDGKRALVSCARSGELVVLDAAARKEVARISMGLRAGNELDARLFGERFGDSPVPVGVLVSPDGRRAYVANTNADVVSVIDLETLELDGRLRAGREPDGMAYAARR
jgi:YVTN family beta-propeller protein